MKVKDFCEWEVLDEKYNLLTNEFYNYTHWSNHRGCHHIDYKLMKILSLDKIPLDNFNQPVVLYEILQDPDEEKLKFFITLRNQSETGIHEGCTKYFYFSEISPKEWTETFHWFLWKDWGIEKNLRADKLIRKIAGLINEAIR